MCNWLLAPPAFGVDRERFAFDHLGQVARGLAADIFREAKA